MREKEEEIKKVQEPVKVPVFEIREYKLHHWKTITAVFYASVRNAELSCLSWNSML
jgi:leucyl aminopeptidase